MTRSDGSASLVAVAVGVVAAVLVGVLGFDLAVVARAHAAAGGAADAAALAAVGARGEAPRDTASRLASANGASLRSCVCAGAVVHVTVEVVVHDLLVLPTPYRVEAGASATLRDLQDGVRGMRTAWAIPRARGNSGDGSLVDHDGHSSHLHRRSGHARCRTTRRVSTSATTSRPRQGD